MVKNYNSDVDQQRHKTTREVLHLLNIYGEASFLAKIQGTYKNSRFDSHIVEVTVVILHLKTQSVHA